MEKWRQFVQHHTFLQLSVHFATPNRHRWKHPRDGNALRTRVAEECQRGIRCLFQIAETYGITAILDAVQDSVCAAVCLQQSVHPQVLFHLKRVLRLRFKTSMEHAHHNQQIHLQVLHPQQQILVVVLKLLAVVDWT